MNIETASSLSVTSVVKAERNCNTFRLFYETFAIVLTNSLYIRNVLEIRNKCLKLLRSCSDHIHVFTCPVAVIYHAL